MDYLNQALASFGINLSWAPTGTTPDVTVHFATTTPEGGQADGVLGFTTAQNAVYIVAGWNFYTGSDPGQIGADQFDFTTLATHELAHTLGLGESQDPDSVMYEYLAPGTVRRSFTDDNLTAIDTDSDRFMKVAATRPMATAAPPVTQVGLTWLSPQVFDLRSRASTTFPTRSPRSVPARTIRVTRRLRPSPGTTTRSLSKSPSKSPSRS